jgi:hypothetical protein
MLYDILNQKNFNKIFITIDKWILISRIYMIIGINRRNKYVIFSNLKKIFKIYCFHMFKIFTAFINKGLIKNKNVTNIF